MRYTTAMGDAYKSYMAFHIHPWYLFMSPWTERKKNIYKACSNERNVEKKIYNRSELWVGLWVHERRAHTPHTIARTHLWRGKRATNDKYVENKNKKQLTHMLCCLCTTYKWNEWMKAIPICLCLCVLCVCVRVSGTLLYHRMACSAMPILDSKQSARMPMRNWVENLFHFPMTLFLFFCNHYLLLYDAYKHHFTVFVQWAHNIFWFRRLLFHVYLCHSSAPATTNHPSTPVWYRIIFLLPLLSVTFIFRHFGRKWNIENKMQQSHFQFSNAHKTWGCRPNKWESNRWQTLSHFSLSLFGHSHEK